MRPDIDAFSRPQRVVDLTTIRIRRGYGDYRDKDIEAIQDGDQRRRSGEIWV